MEIGDKVNFIYSTNTKGEKEILQGKINDLLENNCVLIEVINHKSQNGTLCNRNIADIVDLKGSVINFVETSIM